MKYLIPMASVLALFACSDTTSSNPSDNGGDEIGKTVTEFGKLPEDLPVTYTTPIIIAADTSEYTTLNLGCTEGLVDSSTMNSVEILSILPNKLILENNDNTCLGHMYIGTSTVLTGATWSYAKDTLVSSSIFCDDSDVADTIAEELIGTTLNFTAVTLTSTTKTQNYCWASQNGSEMASNFREDTDSIITMVHYGCDQVNISVGSDDITISLASYNATTREEVISFQYKGKSCSYNKGSIPAISAQTCTAAYNKFLLTEGNSSPWDFEYNTYASTGNNWDEFLTCVSGLGWKNSVAFLK